jgi:hypothetical protein
MDYDVDEETQAMIDDLVGSRVMISLSSDHPCAGEGGKILGFQKEAVTDNWGFLLKLNSGEEVFITDWGIIAFNVVDSYNAMCDREDEVLP